MNVRASLVLLLLLAACTRHGPSRDGAVPVVQELSLRPAADNLVVTWDLVHAIEARQGFYDEHLADGTPNRAPKPGPIEFDRTTIYSDRFPPVDVPLVSAARREILEEAVAAVRDDEHVVMPVHIRTVVERDQGKWYLRFIDTRAGFDLEDGALAKVAEAEPGEKAAVALFLTELDATHFETLTRDYEGRRISIVAGDESLMTPLVNEPISGGVVWINPGDGVTAEDVLARFVQ